MRAASIFPWFADIDEASLPFLSSAAASVRRNFVVEHGIQCRGDLRSSGARPARYSIDSGHRRDSLEEMPPILNAQIDHEAIRRKSRCFRIFRSRLRMARALA